MHWTKELAFDHRVSLGEICRDSGIPPRLFREWEEDDVPLDEIPSKYSNKLARSFGLSMNELLRYYAK